MERNNQAIYYLNKLIALGMEAKRLQEECKQVTGVELCGLGARWSIAEGKFFVQTFESIDKLGLPVSAGDDERIVELNGYKVIEV